MTKRGPVPKPTSLHLLRGSKAVYKRGAEPKTDGKKPRAPTWLSKAEQALFRKLVTGLHSMGVVGSQDAPALARYIRFLTRWLELEAFLAENGQTFVKRGRPTEAEPQGPVIDVRTWPHAKESRQLAGRLIEIEREFGMTPAARARLAIEAGAGDTKGSDAGGGKARFLSG